MDSLDLERYAKDVRLAVEKQVQLIKAEEDLLESLEILVTRSKGVIYEDQNKLRLFVVKVFTDTLPGGSQLESFLKRKPVMPHERHNTYLDALAFIISDLLQSDYGKTTQGGVEDIALGKTEYEFLWKAIEEDFKKILQEFFGITPFLDRTSWVSIGFSVDAKWPQPEPVA